MASVKASTAPSKSRHNVYIAACSANLAALSAGCMLSWTSPTLPRLKEPDSWLRITDEQASRIGSLIMLGAIAGPFLTLLLPHRIGPKYTLMVCISMFVVSWTILAFAHNVETIYVARFLAGIAIGATYSAVQIYVSDIAEDNIRGTLGALMNLFITMGITLEYCVGPYTSYTALISISAGLSLLYMITLSFMPESPYYLITNNRKEEAVKGLTWLRGHSDVDIITSEAKKIMKAVEKTSATTVTFCEMLQGNVYPMFLCCTLQLFQQLSGISTIIFYSESIFFKAGVSLTPSICSILLGFVMTASSSLVFIFVRRCGIKWLLVISALGMSLSEGILGFCYYMHNEDPEKVMQVFDWLPIVCLAFYIVLYIIGFGPLPWSVLAELFPPDLTFMAACFCTSFVCLCAFLVTKYFEMFVILFGAQVVFWFFSVCCILAAAFVVKFLPDTRGMSSDDIQKWLCSDT